MWLLTDQKRLSTGLSLIWTAISVLTYILVARISLKCSAVIFHVLGGPLFGSEKSVMEVITWKHMQALTILVRWLYLRNFWSLDSKLFKWSKNSEIKSTDQNRDGLHMLSRDYLLHTLFWTKKWTPEYEIRPQKNGQELARHTCSWKV